MALLSPSQIPILCSSEVTIHESPIVEGNNEVKPKQRKPTQKQLEEAEAAARPVYDESQRPDAPSSGPLIKILTWNVASLSSTLKKDALAISRLVEKESADIVCLQVCHWQIHVLFIENILSREVWMSI